MLPFANRNIFGPYFNGTKEVYADPLQVHRRLTYFLAGEVNQVLLDANSEDLDVRFKARNHLAAAAVYSLEMVPFNSDTGEGVSEETSIPTLRAYLEYMNTKKEKGPISQTSSLPTQEVGPLLPVTGPLTTPPTYPYGVIRGDCGCKKRGQ